MVTLHNIMEEPQYFRERPQCNKPPVSSAFLCVNAVIIIITINHYPRFGITGVQILHVCGPPKIYYNQRDFVDVKASTYSRNQYKVSIACHLPTVPYFKKKTPLKRLAMTVPFYSAGRDAILLVYGSEYRAESSPCGFFSSVYLCCSSCLFLTWSFRSSPSIVSALLVD